MSELRTWRHGFNCNPPRVSPREAMENDVVLRTERGGGPWLTPRPTSGT
jgi:hypothetical protein